MHEMDSNEDTPKDRMSPITSLSNSGVNGAGAISSENESG
jgi:hypothetical protein